MVSFREVFSHLPNFIVNPEVYCCIQVFEELKLTCFKNNVITITLYSLKSILSNVKFFFTF